MYEISIKTKLLAIYYYCDNFSRSAIFAPIHIPNKNFYYNTYYVDMPDYHTISLGKREQYV